MTDYHINLFFSDEDECWVADLPDFEHCSAFGDTPEEALAELQIAKQAWLEVAREEGVPIPEPRYRPAMKVVDIKGIGPKIEGIGPRIATTLAAAGVRTTEGLLKAAGSASGRKALAAKTKIDDSRLLEWVNRADLMRVRGVGSEFSGLLEAAGVDTVKELGTCQAENLHARMIEVNIAKKTVRRAPAVSEVQRWVTHARSLKAAVTH